jgi:tetratricopeptide (TPR) repeat protein
MVWYQHGPYKAYFEMSRYQDVVNLADTTLFSMGEQTVEETFYWRGLAKEQLGDVGGALADMQKAVELNSNYAEALEELARMQGGG